MRDEMPEVDIPEGWSVCKRRFTGHFKLVAEYENNETGEKVRITPYKTYSQPESATLTVWYTFTQKTESRRSQLAWK